MTDSQHKDISFLLDRIEIQDVIARYSLGQDSHQGDDGNILGEWDRTFTPDAQVDYSAAGGIVGSYRDLARWMRGDASGPGSMSAFSNWQHMLGCLTCHLRGTKRSLAPTFMRPTGAGRAIRRLSTSTRQERSSMS
nr:nuclear transport factor 2 family protein [Paraburkholderia caledonica]